MPYINYKEIKRGLRQKSRLGRRELSDAEKRELDRKIYDNIMRLRQYKACNTIFAYVSTGTEVDTKAVIKKAFLDGKRVAVPRCTDEKGRMVFHYITSLDELRPGSFSVDEPSETAPVAVGNDSCFMLVPAFVIDKKGYRIGYGKGYYDRYIPGFSGQTVGLCYSSEFVNSVPHGKFDQSVDVIVTDAGIKSVK